MPWKDRVKAILAAWYPGQSGGQAVAEILTGAANPSGRLPVTFPASLRDLPRPELPGFGTPEGTPTTIQYSEGAEVGYRWFAKTGGTPLYPFGYGLSYTRFSYSNVKVTGGETVAASFVVHNDGDRAGADVPQLYLTTPGRSVRLLAFERVTLQPGESREVRLVADPRLLASFDGTAGRWRIQGDSYQVTLAEAAGSPGISTTVRIKGRLFGR
jgi:beta-glucosidase